jgi:hypothetical protein
MVLKKPCSTLPPSLPPKTNLERKLLSNDHFTTEGARRIQKKFYLVVAPGEMLQTCVGNKNRKNCGFLVGRRDKMVA